MIRLHGSLSERSLADWKLFLKNTCDRGWEEQSRLRMMEDKFAQTKKIWIEHDGAPGKWQKYTSLPWTTLSRDDDALQQLWGFSDCVKCLNFMVKRPTMGVGSLEPTFAFVGSAPGVGDGEQEKFDRVLVYGPTSHLLRDALYDVDPNILNKTWFTNLMKMSFPENRDGKSKDYAVCFPDLMVELRLLTPKIIFAMGNSVWSFLKTQDIDARIIPMLHPSYFGHKYSTYKDLSFYLKSVFDTEVNI